MNLGAERAKRDLAVYVEALAGVVGHADRTGPLRKEREMVPPAESTVA
jgi:hypothetical protein